MAQTLCLPGRDSFRPLVARSRTILSLSGLRSRKSIARTGRRSSRNQFYRSSGPGAVRNVLR